MKTDHNKPLLGSTKVLFDDVTKIYTKPGTGEVTPALLPINLEVRDSEFLCIVGPSGCGKSTLLACAAGLNKCTEGKVLVDGKRVFGPSPERGVVFQEYALFPWMTLRENIEFGPRLRGVSSEERRLISDQYMELVGLTRSANKYPAELSGGMKQRVALARALANEPEILLMDEPFGALDAMTRESMQEELLEIWQADRRTCIFVTHSIAEAIYLADRVVIMGGPPGYIKQVISVDLPRPRDRTSLDFHRLYTQGDTALRGDSSNAI